MYLVGIAVWFWEPNRIYIVFAYPPVSYTGGLFVYSSKMNIHMKYSF